MILILINVANLLCNLWMYRKTKHSIVKWNTPYYVELMGQEWVDKVVRQERRFGYFFSGLAALSLGLLMGSIYHALSL